MSHKDFVLVLGACPNATLAAQITHEVLAADHAACVNIVPVVRSMYL